MRPCRHCNAALENNITICPECGREQPTGPGPAAAPMPQIDDSSEQSLSPKAYAKLLFISAAVLILIPSLGYWTDGTRGFSIGVVFDMFAIFVVLNLSNLGC